MDSAGEAERVAAGDLWVVALQISKREGNIMRSTITLHHDISLNEEEAVGKAIKASAKLRPGFSVDQYLAKAPLGQSVAAILEGQSDAD